MRFMKFAVSLLSVAVLAGCAHPIVLTPDMNKLDATATKTPHKAVVGYYISDEQRAREVTTPGGGGDKVRYFPYRDMETGLYKILGTSFTDVVRLKTPADAAAISQNKIGYIVTPQVTTTTQSTSSFTWPPTQVTVDLTAEITDAAGKPVASKRAFGIGNAEYEEFKSDFSLAGKRAMLDALQKLQKLLSEASELDK